MRVLCLLLVGTFACGQAQHVSSSNPSDSGWYAVRFTRAVVLPRRPDGSPWHVTQGSNASVAIGALVGLAIGNPGIGLALGESLATPGGDPLAPEPYLRVKLGDHSYRVAPHGRSYAPVWDQPIAIDARNLRGDERVIIQIMDALDDGLISQTELPIGALLDQPSHTLTALGSVASLDIRTDPMPRRRRADYSFVVPSTMSLGTLEHGEPRGWRAVPVWNGDRVSITAAGSVCPGTFSSDCFGPDGVADDRWRSYNYPGLEREPHASLIAVMPDGVHVVGASNAFRVTESGWVLLVVNDTDVGNNSGSFAVSVHVDPPR